MLLLLARKALAIIILADIVRSLDKIRQQGFEGPTIDYSIDYLFSTFLIRAIFDSARSESTCAPLWIPWLGQSSHKTATEPAEFGDYRT